MDKKNKPAQQPIQKRSAFVGDSLFPHFTVKNPVPPVSKETSTNSKDRKFIITGATKKS